MGFAPATLNRCNKIAATMNPERFLSKDGKKLLQIIDLLAKDDPFSPHICKQLVVIGDDFHWDMVNMSPQAERSFCKWLVDTRLAGGK